MKDEDLWQAYKAKVAPVQRKARSSVRAAPSLRPTRRHYDGDAGLPGLPSAVTTVSLKAIALERTREKKIKEGDLVLDKKLDLHGMRQDEAFETLALFLRRATKQEWRNLLIVTGKGTRGEGVLRKNLTAWLAMLPEAQRILTVRAAAVRHGGDGAFYVILRRKGLKS